MRHFCAFIGKTKTSHAVLFRIYIITFTSKRLGNPIWRIVVGRKMNRERNLRKERERNKERKPIKDDKKKKYN